MLSHLLLLAAQAVTPVPATPPPAAAPAKAWPTREADFSIPDFHFRSGETLPSLRIHYTMLGQPHRNAVGEIDNAVMVLHGTGGWGGNFLNPVFADQLYGPGQPLDITRYWIILPDGIGTGKSSNRPTGCTCISRNMIMTTWSRHNTACSATGSASSGCG